MAENDPTIIDAVFAARAWARAEISPYVTWLPDWLEPYAVDIGAGFLLFGMLLGIVKYGLEMWRVVIWLPKTLWRWKTGYEAPPSETAATKQNTEEILRLLLDDRAKSAEAHGVALPEDALERAEAAIREVLQSNDPAKAEARQALRDGDVQGAEDALEKAFDREAEAYARLNDESDQLKAKAARTAREKAALAATRSVADALNWYSKAAALAPEDFWTQIELARLYQLSGNLDAAMTAARAAMGAAMDDRDRSVALDDIGDVLRSQGDLVGALASYRSSMEIVERLASADASNAGLQRDLSVSHNKIGDVLGSQGDLGGALASYRSSMEIVERLASADASNAGLQRDLSVSHNKIGDVLRSQGDLGGALASYRSSMEIFERLASADASNAGLQRDLSVSHNKIGDVLGSQGDLGGALASYRSSMEIVERLASADASNAGLQRDLSVSHDRIGDVLGSQGDLGGALASYRSSMEIFERLASADASNAGLQRDLSVSHERIGDLYEARGDIAAAVEAYEASLPIARAIANQFPDHPQFQSDLRITERRLAELRAKLP